jgi:acetyltransferase
MTKGGSSVTIQRIRGEDEPRVVEFHKGLSDGTVYLRYFQGQRLESRVEHERLIRKCFLDYDREMALVAERLNQDTNRRDSAHQCGYSLGERCHAGARQTFSFSFCS